QCRAWTYVKPGVQGNLARCWLKNQVPNPVRNATFAISGVTRPAAPIVPPAPPAPVAGAGLINIHAATSGQNCKAKPNNVIGHVKRICDGTNQCDYRVDVNVLGDPVSSCAKDYVIAWTCGSNAQPRRATS